MSETDPNMRRISLFMPSAMEEGLPSDLQSICLHEGNEPVSISIPKELLPITLDKLREAGSHFGILPLKVTVEFPVQDNTKPAPTL